MIRLLVWCAGTCLWVYLLWRYGYWHQMLAVGVVILAALWVLGGAFAISQRGRRHPVVPGVAPRSDSPFADAVKAAELERKRREAVK